MPERHSPQKAHPPPSKNPSPLRPDRSPLKQEPLGTSRAHQPVTPQDRPPPRQASPHQSGPPGPRPVPRPAGPRGFRRGLQIIGVIIGIGAASTALAVVLARDDAVSGPHRAVGGYPSPPVASGSPRWAVPAHRWVRLSKAWDVPHHDELPRAYALASDGQRVFTTRENIDQPSNAADAKQEASLTAYDGASGVRLWRRTVPWLKQASPAAGNGIIVVPSSPPERLPDSAQYTAYDARTGAERWRVTAGRRVNFPYVRGRASNPPGVFIEDTFYYGDGASVVGVDAATGRIRYQWVGQDESVVAGPVPAAGRLAVITRAPDGPGVPAPPTSTVWVFTPDLKHAVAWDLPSRGRPHTIMVSGDILVASSDRDIWAVDARTHRILWTMSLPPHTEVEGALGNIVITQDFHITNEQEYSGHDIVTGKRIWRNNPPEFTDPKKNDEYMVGIVDGTIFSSAHGITIINAANGKRVFTHETDNAGGLVTAAAGSVVVYNRDGIKGFK